MEQLKTEKNYNHNIQKAIHFIENNFIDTLSIEELAHISGYSSFHFQRLFKHYTQESVHHYINRIRIEKAAFMLKYEKSSISEVMWRTGFTFNASFYRTFRKYFNICPKEFRDLYKNKFLSNEIPDFQIIDFKEKDVFFTRTYGDYKFSEPLCCNNMEILCTPLLDKNTNYISICYDEPTISTNKNKMRYDACIVASDTIDSKNIPVKTLQGGKYAKFHFKGTLNELDNFFYTIYETFFHHNEYQISIKPTIQIHHNSFHNLLHGVTQTDLLIPLD